MTRLITLLPTPTNPDSTQRAPSHRRGLYVSLVASVVLVILFGAILVTNQGQIGAPMPRLTNSTFEYGGHVTSTDSEQAISAMKQAGMTWIKIEKNYTGALSTDTREDIEKAHANGFKVLIHAKGTSRSMQRGGDEYVQAYAKWVGQMAAAGADAIEIWSDPGPDPYFSWVSPTNWYVDMLRQSYEAIKSTNPDTLVITADSASPGAEALWLRNLIDEGGLQYADCVGVSYEEGVLPPDALSGDPRDSYYTRYFPSLLETYASIIDSKNDTGYLFVGDKPLCILDIGYLAPEGVRNATLPGLFSWASHITVAQQAEWLAQAAVIASESGHVRLMIVENIDYTTSGSYPQKGYAIVRPDGGCPACEALADLR